ncbi:MAG: glycosyltransferase family 1 protein, partial [Acidobacteria bacterium]
YVARQRGIPYVVSLHGGVYDVPAEEAQSWTAPTRGAIEWGKVLGWWVGSRRVLADAAAILCVGQREQEETQRRYPHKRVIHLPNGVDPDRFAHGDGAGFRHRYGIPLTAHVILTMGRIDPQKNQRLAIRVLPELLKTDPHLHLLLIGPVTNDAYYRQLVDDVRRRGIEAHVTIIPGLDAGSRDLVDAYHAADVFLLPSIHEPFGIVILEAWAAGRPVVASRVGGVPSFVVHGRDGLLFDPHDERACRQAIHEMLTHPQRRRSLAEAGCAKARHEYSWDRITERLVAIYREVIDENSLRQRKMWVLRWRRTEYC